MTPFILIFWLVVGSTTIPATGSVQFADQAACETAHQALNARWANSFNRDVGVCVPSATTAAKPPVSSIDPGFGTPVDPGATLDPCAVFATRGVYPSNGLCSR